MFSKRLKKLREEFGLNQKQLADKIKIGNKTISDYERAISSPDLETLKIIADFFNVSIDYLIGNTNIRTTEKNISIEDIEIAFYNQHGIVTEHQKKEIEKFINYVRALNSVE